MAALAATLLLTVHCANRTVNDDTYEGGAPATSKPSGGLLLGGQPDAAIRVEVFSDYQCPRCREFYFQTLKPLIAEYCASNKVCVVYHDFPLQMHPFSRKATALALAAARLGKDPWLRVTEALYKYQDEWAQSGDVEAIVARVLDPTEMTMVKKLSTEPGIQAALEQEVALALSLRIAGTPTFFITPTGAPQQRVNQIVTYPVLKDYIERILKH